MTRVLMALLLAFLVPAASVAWEQDQYLWSAPWSWQGPIPKAKFGLSVASGGDVNGDGIDDLVCAAPFDSTGGVEVGTVFVIFGSAGGWEPELNVSDVAAASFKGEAYADHPGGSEEGGAQGVAIIPSLNGDPYDDIVVAASGNDEAGLNFGKVYIIFGKTSGWALNVPLSSADASFVGEASLGESPRMVVASAGDVDNDGRGDFLIGAPFIGSGKVYLILGKDTGWGTSVSLSNADASFVGEQDATGLSRAGFVVSGVPDFNSDGRDEILIGAPKFTPDFSQFFLGKAYVVLGKASGWSLNDTLNTSDLSFVGEVSGDEVGSGVVGAGDVDNDSKGDFIITSRIGTGHLYLFLGSSLTPPASDIPIASGDTHIACADLSTGDAMAMLGDVDNDGYDDFAVGAPFFDAGPGKAYAIFGRSSWPAELDIEESEGGWKGLSGKFWAGGSIAGGDVNNDGLPDLIVGAGADPFGGYDAGAVYVIPSNYGADTTPPMRTTDLDAAFDVEGRATLTWSQVTQDANGQPEDVLFYRVLRHRHRFTDSPKTFVKHLPAVIHPETSISDTLNIMGDVDNFYYYRLITIDESGNVTQLSTGTGEIDFLTDIP